MAAASHELGFSPAVIDGMKPAFAVLGILPPPPTCSQIFAGLDSAGAACAADAGETPVVQGIVGNTVRANEVPNVSLRPICYRVQLIDVSVIGVNLKLGQQISGNLLLSSLAGDPDLRSL